MQIGRRVMLRVLGLMGFGFLFRELGTAEDVYATPTPTPTPAPMQAVLYTGQTVRDTLARLLSKDGPWHRTNDLNKPHAVNIHSKLNTWDNPPPPPPPTTYKDLAKDLGEIKKELDAVQVHPGPTHPGPKQCSGTDMAQVRCELEGIDMLVRQHYDALKDNHIPTGPSLGPAPDPGLPDDKSIVALSSDIRCVFNEVANLLETYHLRTSKGVRYGETKGKDS